MIPKFRAWLKEKQLMIDVCEMTFLYDEVHTVSDEHYNFYASDEIKLMQFTGLKDKHGEEVYEGDIIKFVLTDGFNYAVDEYGVVTYKMGAFYVINGLAEYLISDINTNKVEVVGNKYENPELLKGE